MGAKEGIDGAWSDVTDGIFYGKEELKRIVGKEILKKIDLNKIPNKGEKKVTVEVEITFVNGKFRSITHGKSKY